MVILFLTSFLEFHNVLMMSIPIYILINDIQDLLFLHILITTNIFLTYFVSFIFYVYIVHAYIHVYHVCASWLQRSEQGIKSFVTAVTDGHEPPRVYWTSTQVLCKNKCHI